MANALLNHSSTSFLIASFVFVLGGGPSDGLYGSYWGARLYNDPGALANGFPGVCGVFVTAAFSYAGSEADKKQVLYLKN